MPSQAWEGVSAPALHFTDSPSCLPGGRFHYSIPAVLNVCSRLHQDVFFIFYTAVLYPSTLWMRGKGATYQASNFSVELLLQQYFVAVCPQVNVRDCQESKWYPEVH